MHAMISFLSVMAFARWSSFSSGSVPYLEQPTSQSFRVEMPHRRETAVAPDPPLRLELTLPAPGQKDRSQAQTETVDQLRREAQERGRI